MKNFLDNDFLLNKSTAVKLYNEFSKNMPIIDYHCHIDAKEIANDIRFENITKLWLGGDHYKWRYMRACGIEEKYITGNASDKEKFIKWIEALSYAAGNPLYHWSHLELKKYFGFDSFVTPGKAEELWDYLNSRLSSTNMSARSVIADSNVALLCTTDDPTDNLYYHELLKKDTSFKTKVLPAFRPDNAVLIGKADYLDYLTKIETTFGSVIKSYSDLKNFLSERIVFFNNHGCRLADHGLNEMIYEPCSEDEAAGIFAKKLNGDILSVKEINKFITSLLIYLHKEYKKYNWTSQLHYGCIRDNNAKMYQSIGPNTGFDAININSGTEKLAPFLNALCDNDALGRIIVYSLNPADNNAIDTIIACFNDSSDVCKIQHGSAWWFNDSKTGIESHLATLASNGSLANFVGMLTDSRSFVSYTRHDYFRRILCNYVGTLIENGEFPDDDSLTGEIIRNISYNNALRYFNFD